MINMINDNFSAAELLSILCDYAQRKLNLSPLDRIAAENNLLSYFKEPQRAIAQDSQGKDLQTDILDPLLSIAKAEYLWREDSERILCETKIMGFVTPSPAVVAFRFDAIASNSGIPSALDYLNAISVNSNYIRMADIKKNVRWKTPYCGEKGEIKVTINLAKPEKNNRDVSLDALEPANKYPACALCVENVGFAGSHFQAPRQTLRVIPIWLADEPWYLQFSPYVYFEHHAIALSEVHRPMKISAKTFTRLLDFVDLFPDYFIGSNADLPIVGGSILAHDHFQGGKRELPMFSRPFTNTFDCKSEEDGITDLKISIVDWYNSCIAITSSNRSQLQAAANEIFEFWKTYSDEKTSPKIVALDKNGEHNTVTPVAVKNGDEYTLYMLLRNNRCDTANKHGIFHSPDDCHHIKSEGIGLIEAMGLFILPGRLHEEFASIKKVLTGKISILDAMQDKSLDQHGKMLSALVAQTNAVPVNEEEAQNLIEAYVYSTCEKILNATAVFKNTPAGKTAFIKFLRSAGLPC
ncbi:MAG: galactose-1-phosphate uridylyltransferase [Christensenellaceae bacterium]|jgi:UDPglucose--hexose-1-phosphate uridylyltransferase|nr:galactose-1-phosphate uridylyltransferase [Christensenellaceae bacterium]